MYRRYPECLFFFLIETINMGKCGRVPKGSLYLDRQMCDGWCACGTKLQWTHFNTITFTDSHTTLNFTFIHINEYYTWRWNHFWSVPWWRRPEDWLVVLIDETLNNSESEGWCDCQYTQVSNWERVHQAFSQFDNFIPDSGCENKLWPFQGPPGYFLPGLKAERLTQTSVFKPGLNSTVLYPPCYASPGKLSAEQLRTPHDVYSSSGPSLPSPPSAGKQPSDALWPLLQTLGLKTRGTFWLNGSSTSRTKREPVMAFLASSALISKYHLSPKSVCLGSDVTPSYNLRCPLYHLIPQQRELEFCNCDHS